MKKYFTHYASLTILFFIAQFSFAQVQKGQNIYGQFDGEFSGRVVSMPDENTIAIGSVPYPTTIYANGVTRIYSWNGTDWIQKGSTIFGEGAADYSGYTISMPDSNTIAIGAPYNDSAGVNTGHARIFKWNGTDWVQKGNSILGEAADDNAGASVSMPDSNTVAIGAPNNDENGTNAGNARVFTWDGANWVQKGNDLYGEAAEDHAGSRIEMPNNNTIAVAALYNDGNGIAADIGHVRIYTWNGTDWIQKGFDINGENADDRMGYSMSMPDENTIAIGSINNDDGGSDAGHMRVFEWNGTAWVQKGFDIDGDGSTGADSYFGWSVSMPSADILAVGAPNQESNSSYSNNGQVKVYSWNGLFWVEQNSIDGQYNGYYCGTGVSMPNDTTIGIGVNGGETSGIYNAGLTWVFNVCPATYSTTNVTTVCDSLISPSTNHVWTTTGVYLDTLTNAIGCDSIIITNLTINNSSRTETIYACNSYTWIDGNTYTASNNTASVTYTNALGCDSTINLNLIIQTPFYNLTDTVVACDSYTWANGTTYTGANSVILDTLNSLGGCDSVVTLHLTLLNSTGSTTTAQACNSYTWIDGNTYTASDDSITYVLTNAVGCDSVIRLDLTIDTLVASTDYVDATTLEGSILGDYEHYEWVECQGSQYPSISVDSSLIFTPENNGAYALMVFNDSGCVDTSDCKTITVTGVETIEGEETFTLYPNPTTGDVTVALNQTYSTVSVSVRNTLGQETFAKDYHSTTTIDLELKGNAGIYFIQLKTDHQTHVLKVVKE